MFLPTAFMKIVDIPNIAFYCKWNIWLIRNKIPDGEFYWSADHELYS